MNALFSIFVAPKNAIANSSDKGDAIINAAIPGINHLNLDFFNFLIFDLSINSSISLGSPLLKILNITTSPIITPVAPINAMIIGLKVFVKAINDAVAGAAVKKYPNEIPAIKTPII